MHVVNTLEACRSSCKLGVDQFGRPVVRSCTHARADRNRFECEHGVSFCRRCGVLIEWDALPKLVTAKKSCPGIRSWSWPLAGGDSKGDESDV